MPDTESESLNRRRYEDALTRAMASAERHLPRDEALEIAHDVASEMVGLPAERVTGGLIYVAVTTRLRMHRRSRERRAKNEGRYHEIWSRIPSVWIDPAASVELRELEGRVAACVAAMPARMREAFLLIRDAELSYRDAADRLGVGVGTVHTQFSRATALLRECVAQYQADAPAAARTNIPNRKRLS
jgi:RNA polymerase sigma factor (sigma-70 family)